MGGILTPTSYLPSSPQNVSHYFLVFEIQVESGAIVCRSPSISLELGSSLDESQLFRDKISRLQQEREHLSSQV